MQIGLTNFNNPRSGPEPPENSWRQCPTCYAGQYRKGSAFRQCDKCRERIANIWKKMDEKELEQ